MSPLRGHDHGGVVVGAPPLREHVLGDDDWMLEGALELVRDVRPALDSVAEDDQQLIGSYRSALGLDSLGEMAAGIVHDIGNILNPLRLQVGVLQRSQNPETIAQVVRNLESVIARGVGILERFRRFGREGPDVLEDVELGAIAQEVVMLLQSRIRASSARVEIQSTQPQRVRASSSELASPLVNLIVNFLDALPREGGWVIVRTGGGDGRAWIEVEDNGHGTSPEVQRRLFTAFFTTKGEAGTGLGLASVAAFNGRQGGTIDVRSAPGRGSCIKLSFPVAPAEPLYASPEAAPRTDSLSVRGRCCKLRRRRNLRVERRP